MSLAEIDLLGFTSGLKVKSRSKIEIQPKSEKKAKNKYLECCHSKFLTTDIIHLVTEKNIKYNGGMVEKLFLFHVVV